MAVSASPEAVVAPADAALSGINWFHSIALGNGVITAGRKTADALKMEADIVFKRPVAGKTVLDIGAWDGYFSFEAERRGASRIVACDSFIWRNGGNAGFDLAHRRLGSRVESLNVDVFDLDPTRQGRFDVVLFLGVLYHLKNPLEGLERAAAMTKDLLVVETQLTERPDSEPVMQYYPRGELYNDPTNYWAPNKACLRAMLAGMNFARVEVADNPVGVWYKPRSYFRQPLRMVGRAFAHAYRGAD